MTPAFSWGGTKNWLKHVGGGAKSETNTTLEAIQFRARKFWCYFVNERISGKFVPSVRSRNSDSSKE